MRVAVAGIDADELVALAHFDGLRMRRYSRRRRWVLRPTLAEGLDVGQSAAVEDGQLEVVQLDDDVVDAHADERGEQMLGGGDEDALAHEAGGVADFGDVAAGGGNFESCRDRCGGRRCRSRRARATGAWGPERRSGGRRRRTQSGRKLYFPDAMIQPSAFLNEDIDYNREWKVLVWQIGHTRYYKSHGIGCGWMLDDKSEKKRHLRG